MLSIAEWGHARLEYEEDISRFHIKITWILLLLVSLHSGLYNETCLTSD